MLILSKQIQNGLFHLFSLTFDFFLFYWLKNFKTILCVNKMSRKILLLFLPLFFLLLIRCDKSTNPPDENSPPPGYQEDIPWSSLADSPWPMNNADPQNTGRSKSLGPLQGEIEWEFEGVNMNAGIAIGSDSTIYFCPSISNEAALYALKPNGILKWKLLIPGRSVTTPTIANDATIYAIIDSRKLVAVDTDGSIIWDYNFDNPVGTRGIQIDKEGNLFLIDNGRKLYVIDKQGQLKWSQINDWGDKITFSPDGNTIYSPDGNTIYISGFYLTAFDIKKQNIVWKSELGSVSEPVMIDSDGNIYVTFFNIQLNTAKFYSLNPDGSVRWVFNKNIPEETQPTIDKNGNIYLVDYDTLYSFNYSGEIRWRLKLEGINSSAPLVSDINGNIFVQMDVPVNNISLVAVNSNGNILWNLILDAVSGRSPALAFNRLIISTWDSQIIYSIR